jgi:hypothetical protein
LAGGVAGFESDDPEVVDPASLFVSLLLSPLVDEDESTLPLFLA